MMRMSTPLSSRCVAKLCRSTCTLTRLSSPAAAVADRQAACTGRVDRRIGGAARKQEQRRPRQPPIAAQDVEQGLGEHDVALLAALPMFDPHHHALVVDI